MQTLLKEYGEAILAAIATVLIIGLVFGGFSLLGKTGRITGQIDDDLVREDMMSSEAALKTHMDIKAANVHMSGLKSVRCGQRISYGNGSSDLIKTDTDSIRSVNVNHVYLIYGSDDNEGYEVTDQVVSYDDKSLVFDMPGSYRLVIEITDSNNVISDYQVFITAIDRREQ